MLQEIMTLAKQTCAYITHFSGRDTTRLRFIQLLIHKVMTHYTTSDVYECSTCLGYADYKFNEDAEVVKQPELERFLRIHFGVCADMPLPVAPQPIHRYRSMFSAAAVARDTTSHEDQVVEEETVVENEEEYEEEAVDDENETEAVEAQEEEAAVEEEEAEEAEEAVELEVDEIDCKRKHKSELY